MSPSEQRFRGDLEKLDFLAGESQEIWRVDAIRWPDVIVVIKSDSGREYTVRFQCEAYPDAPTAQLWDAVKNCVSIPNVANCSARMQKLLSNHPPAFYMPCDRQYQGYSDWDAQYANQQWDNQRGIVSYLEQLQSELD